MAIPIFYIFLPLFASSLGANALELGLVGGTSYAVYSFMPFVMGHFSDRRGSRRFFILASFLVLCTVSFLYSVSGSAVSIIVVRIFEGLGWAMLWPAMEAAVTEESTRDPKGTLAVFNYSWSAGAAAGPVLGTILVTTFSYRAAFLASAVLLAAPIVLNGVTFLRDGEVGLQRGTEGAKTSPVEHPTLSSSVRGVFSSGEGRRGFVVWSSFVLVVLSTATSAVLFTFFGPYATSIGITVVLVGAVTTTYAVVRLITYIALARMSLRQRVLDGRVRVRNLAAFASVASLSSLLLFIRDATGTANFLAFALFGVCSSVVYALSQTTLIAETSPERRGAAAGLFESSIGLGGVFGPIIAGAVSSGSLSTAFAVPPVILALALGFLYFMSRGARHLSNDKSQPNLE